MKLFKGRQPAAVSEKPRGKGNPLSGYERAVLAILLISVSIVFGLILTRQTRFSAPVYQPGDIARADIIIPMDVFIEDETATRARRAEAKAEALPVYRFDPSLPADQVSRLQKAFAQSRALLGLNPNGGESHGRPGKRSFRTLPAALKSKLRSTLQDLGMKPPVDDLLTFLVREGYRPGLEDQIVLILRDVASSLLFPDDARMIQEKRHMHKADVVTGKVETIPVTLLSTRAQIRNRIDEQISLNPGLAVSSRRHIRRILNGLINPNLTYDASLTESRAQDDVKNVDLVLRKLKEGKVILRQGDEVGADHLAQIDAVRKLSRTDISMRQVFGMAVLAGILLTILAFFVRFITLNQWRYLRLVAFLILTLTVNLLLLKAAWFVCESVSQSFLSSPFNDKTYFYYLLPFAYGSMLVTLLAGERCAQMFLLVFCILAGHSLGADSYGYFYILITGLTGMIFMRKADQRIGFIAAGVKLGLFSAVLFILLQAAGQAPLAWISGSFGAALAFLSGLINSIFLIFTLPLCERIFMVTTELRLSELGNMNLNLIRELILKAPGTYNHSVAVGTLCEGAAKTIGLNPLFLRIASLYHDIGKTAHPEYFVENQQGVNPHERIGIEQSVRILKGHVTGGASMAKKAKLPSSIVDLILQHHGTKVMHFFYEKAKGQAAPSDGEVQEAPFRYFGPKPQTKAAAILMLADCIEAAARTLQSHCQNTLLHLIRKIITDTVEDGQFSECEITLSEIDRITYSFLETLSSHYHGRIVYPGFDFNEPRYAAAEGLR
ncbi:MAG: HDIG domain-containing metalloprotein [Thermodesulfobacteriota bacterium]